MKSIIETLQTLPNNKIFGAKFEVLKEGKVGIIANPGFENLVQTFFERNGYKHEIYSISEYKKRNPLSVTSAAFAVTGNLFK